MSKIIEQFVFDAFMSRRVELKINDIVITYDPYQNGFWTAKLNKERPWEWDIKNAYRVKSYLDEFGGLWMVKMVEDMSDELSVLTGQDENSRLEAAVKELNGMKINFGEPKMAKEDRSDD